MAGLIPQHFIDQLIARTDIVELISSRVQLRKAGREYKACCPFHDEKTPSFTVSPSKQFYHCFGCGEHGTAIGFLMAFEHLNFVEAVEELASMAALEVPREGDNDAAPRVDPDLYTVLARADEHFQKALGQAAEAIEYVKARGIDRDTATAFGLGFAADSWDRLLTALRPGASEKLLAEAGLVIERDSGQGCYDRFRGRLMFPIRDHRGRTIAFGGRVLGKGEPKYLNSPETPVFHKGRELYGLYEARQALRELPRLLVVEGYMDVVGLARHGIRYAVATLGTATTPDHLTRLFRITGEIVFCFDGDRAGRQAAWRALENSLPAIRDGRQVRFLFLPEGHDPDSLVNEEGAPAFESRLAGAEPLSEVLLKRLAESADLTSVDGRAKLAESARPYLARIPDGVYRDMLVDRLAQMVQLDRNRLVERLVDRGDEYGFQPRTTATANAGRPSLMRQAVGLVVQYPADVARAPARVELAAQLVGCEKPGASLLASLLQHCETDPKLSTAALLERWRDEPDYRHLTALARMEMLVEPGDDLNNVFLRLASALGPQQRLETLLARANAVGLGPEEKLELKDLLTITAQKPPAG